MLPQRAHDIVLIERSHDEPRVEIDLLIGQHAEINFADRAIDGVGVESYEAYPDLAFRLWASGAEIPPKGAGRSALAARVGITRRLADELGCEGATQIMTLDEADAAVLALSAVKARRGGAIVLIEEAGEGRFALAIDRDQAERSGL